MRSTIARWLVVCRFMSVGARPLLPKTSPVESWLPRPTAHSQCPLSPERTWPLVPLIELHTLALIRAEAAGSAGLPPSSLPPVSPGAR